MAKKKAITSSADVHIPTSEEAVRRWIPVQERLPDSENEWHMVIDDNGDRDYCLLESSTDALGNDILLWRKQDGTHLPYVTHWLEIGQPDDEDNV